jgi:hypothetical protein
MAKSRARRGLCSICGEPPHKGGRLTNNGYHLQCGMQKNLDAANDLRLENGKYWERWNAGVGPLGLQEKPME